jgi:hypothetical protein
VCSPAGTLRSSNEPSSRGRRSKGDRGQNAGGHVRMNVAIDLHETRLLEQLGPGLPLRISVQVERGRRRQREHIMKNGSAFERDRRSARDGDHVRHERLVFLLQLGRRRRQGRGTPRPSDTTTLRFGNGRHRMARRYAWGRRSTAAARPAPRRQLTWPAIDQVSAAWAAGRRDRPRSAQDRRCCEKNDG